MTYDDRFFDSIREGSQRSAAAVVPLVMERFNPATVVDVGCGEGLWGKAFEDAGCEVLGLDGHPDPIIPARSVDLAYRLPTFANRFDLAVCLEVAEHLPLERAATFVAELCGIADAVLFSAAVPGQGGTGHLNEQWPQYWVDLFQANSFTVSDELRWEVWDDENVCWWYRQNLMVATAWTEGWSPPPLGPPIRPRSEIRPVIHPGAWAHFGHR